MLLCSTANPHFVATEQYAHNANCWEQRQFGPPGSYATPQIHQKSPVSRSCKKASNVCNTEPLLHMDNACPAFTVHKHSLKTHACITRSSVNAEVSRTNQSARSNWTKQHDIAHMCIYFMLSLHRMIYVTLTSMHCFRPDSIHPLL